MTASPGTDDRWLTRASGDPEYNIDLPDYLMAGSKLRKDVEAWCYENMSDEQWVSVYSFTTEKAKLHATSETELVHFKLRWFNTEDDDG